MLTKEGLIDTIAAATRGFLRLPKAACWSSGFQFVKLRVFETGLKRNLAANHETLQVGIVGTKLQGQAEHSYPRQQWKCLKHNNKHALRKTMKALDEAKDKLFNRRVLL